MSVSKKFIFIACIISIVLSIVLTLWNKCLEDAIENIIVGILTSCLVTAITSFCTYYDEKRKLEIKLLKLFDKVEKDITFIYESMHSEKVSNISLNIRNLKETNYYLDVYCPLFKNGYKKILQFAEELLEQMGDKIATLDNFNFFNCDENAKIMFLIEDIYKCIRGERK